MSYFLLYIRLVVTKCLQVLMFLRQFAVIFSFVSWCLGEIFCVGFKVKRHHLFVISEQFEKLFTKPG